MAVRLEKPWIDLNISNVAKVAGHLGVYELANKNEEIVYIGVADATSNFGLREKLERELQYPRFGACRFRVEINMAYRTRHTELLQVYLYDRDKLPVGNEDTNPNTLGRLRPGGTIGQS